MKKSKTNQFHKHDMPMPTVQLQINRRPHIAHRGSSETQFKIGRYPTDKRPRYKEPIPPFRADKESEQATSGDNN